MANVKRKKHSHHMDMRKFWSIVLIALIFAFILWYEYISAQQAENQNTSDNYQIEVIDATQSNVPDGDLLLLHMIDCGQADSFLFEQNDKYGLIDCGTRGSGDDVVKYLQNHGVTDLQFVMGTHPHEDHMGGMEDVLNNFKCEQIYTPKVGKGSVTSNWYISLLKTIKQKKVPVTNLETGSTFNLGNASFNVLEQFTPKEAGDNLNNLSTVVKVSFGAMDVLMTGDAEFPVENKMLAKQLPLQCELLKVGHHGSGTSTSKDFLDAVSPQYALISCEIGNRYNHPYSDTMNLLKKENIPTYRTDENGDVIVRISSKDIMFEEQPGDYVDGPTLAKMKGVS